MTVRRPIALLACWFVLAGVSAQEIGQVRGTIRGSTGEPLMTQLILVAEAGGREFAVSTDDQGRFSVDLAPGGYLVYRTVDEVRTLLGHVVAEGGEIANFDFQAGDPDPLAAIRDFDVGWRGAESVQQKSLADVVNPFPARRQGRLFGSVYEFHRNDKLDARNFFDPVGVPLPRYRRNQFGVTAGFRWNERLNLLGSYEGLRIGQGSTLLSKNPTLAMKQGDFSELGIPITDPFSGLPFEGNRIPADRIHPVSAALTKLIPDPNRPDPDRNFVNNEPRVRNQNRFNVRTDYEPSRGASLVLEYFYTGGNNRRVAPIDLFSSNQAERHQEIGLSYSRPLTSRLQTFSRFELERNRVEALSQNASREGLLQSLGIAGIEIGDALDEGYPYFDLTGYVDFGDRNSPQTSVRNRGSAEFSTTYSVGQHTLRSGAEISARQLNGFRSDGWLRGVFNFSGVFTGDAFADLLMGIPYSAYRGVGSTRADLRASRWAFFLNDQWRISPRFQLSMGVEYSFNHHWHSTRDNVAGFHPLRYDPPLTGTVISAGSPEASRAGFDGALAGSLVFPDRNDWSPNLGFAFNPFGNNRYVIRGGYTIWHQTPDQWYFTESLTRNFPYYYVASVESSRETPQILLDRPFAAEVIPEVTIRAMDPWIRNGYLQQWRLAIQGELARNLTTEVVYLGRRGNSLTRSIPGNVPLPGPEPIASRRPNPGFGRFEVFSHGGASSLHLLAISGEKRLSEGWSVRSGFEWNRSMDDVVWSDPQNPRDMQAEKARSVWAVPRRIYLNYIVDLPFASLPFVNGHPDWLRWATQGWRLSGITEVQSGQPFTVVIPGDPNNDGVYGDRPDRIADGNLPKSRRTVDRWFDIDAFRQPEPYSFGNSGRNILIGPGHHAWDISVIKQTRLADGDTLELRVELFNAFNHVNFNQPSAAFGTSTFGKIYGADRSREIEVAIKYTF